MTFPLPKAVLEQHVILLGKTRSGKSSKLRLIVEHLLDAGKPVCIIDPKGDWWGLKSSADGKSAGYAVVIFGGEHADVPINRHSGAAVAELIATGNRPCIIDLGGWMVSERTEFFIAFASHLFKLTKGTRYLAIDEVHNFCPKGKIMDPNAGRMLHWANRLASEGAGKGVLLAAASQRPQKVHNDFLTSCETLIACRVIHKADRDAIKDWIDGAADPEIGRQVLAGLAQMDRPDAWVWSPEARYGPKVVTFPLFRTYDSFKAQAADTGRLKGWAAVDLDDVRAKLAAAVAEAEANDPAALKREIALLRRSAATPTPDETLIEAAEQRGERRGYGRGLKAYDNWVSRLRDNLIAAMQQADKIVFAALDLELDRQPREPFVKDEKSKQMERVVAEIPILRKHRGHAVPIVERVQREYGPDGGGDLAGLRQRLVNAIARLNADGIEPVTREAAGALAGAKASGGYCSNMLGQLKTAGLIEFPAPGMVALTDKGRGVANPGAIKGELADHWLSLVAGLERDILRVLIESYPATLSREEIGRRLNKSSEGGYFSNMIGKLKSMGAIEYPQSGVLALTRNVMP